MPRRRVHLVDGYIYHVFNRGVSSFPIFLQESDFRRFLELINFLRFNPRFRYSYFARLTLKQKELHLLDLHNNNSPIVDILSFCLMQNHFHLLIKQKKDKGLQVFMGNVQNSYVKYFNLKNKRIGPLFQSAFQAVRIETDEQFLHVSRYIHLNPVSSNLINVANLENYRWSSYIDYVTSYKHRFINKKELLQFFKYENDYRKFVLDHADYQKALQKIKSVTID